MNNKILFAPQIAGASVQEFAKWFVDHNYHKVKGMHKPGWYWGQDQKKQDGTPGPFWIVRMEECDSEFTLSSQPFSKDEFFTGLLQLIEKHYDRILANVFHRYCFLPKPEPSLLAKADRTFPDPHTLSFPELTIIFTKSEFSNKITITGITVFGKVNKLEDLFEPLMR